MYLVPTKRILAYYRIYEGTVRLDCLESEKKHVNINVQASRENCLPCICLGIKKIVLETS